MSKIMKPCKASMNLFPPLKYRYDVYLHVAENFHLIGVGNFMLPIRVRSLDVKCGVFLKVGFTYDLKNSMDVYVYISTILRM